MIDEIAVQSQDDAGNEQNQPESGRLGKVFAEGIEELFCDVRFAVISDFQCNGIESGCGSTDREDGQ